VAEAIKVMAKVSNEREKEEVVEKSCEKAKSSSEA
jgi:hypothetical protein